MICFEVFVRLCGVVCRLFLILPSFCPLADFMPQQWRAPAAVALAGARATAAMLVAVAVEGAGAGLPALLGLQSM